MKKSPKFHIAVGRVTLCMDCPGTSNIYMHAFLKRRGPFAHKEVIYKMLRFRRVLRPYWDSLKDDSLNPGLLAHSVCVKINSLRYRSFLNERIPQLATGIANLSTAPHIVVRFQKCALNLAARTHTPLRVCTSTHISWYACMPLLRDGKRTQKHHPLPRSPAT